MQFGSKGGRLTTDAIFVDLEKRVRNKRKKSKWNKSEKKNEIKKNYRKPVRTTEYKFHLELVRQKNTLFRLKSDFIIEKVSDTRFLLLRKNDEKNIPNRQVEKSKRTHENWNINFWFKKDPFKALWISRTIYDWSD